MYKRIMQDDSMHDDKTFNRRLPNLIGDLGMNEHFDYEWFIKADDDTFLLTDNLREYLGNNKKPPKTNSNTNKIIGNDKQKYRTAIHPLRFFSSTSHQSTKTICSLGRFL